MMIIVVVIILLLIDIPGRIKQEELPKEKENYIIPHQEVIIQSIFLFINYKNLLHYCFTYY